MRKHNIHPAKIDTYQAVVDDNMVDQLAMGGVWLYHDGYAARWDGAAKKLVLMHRLVMGVVNKTNCMVDHINGDRLDNRRENLRVVTHKQNNRNRCALKTRTSRATGRRRRCTSIYKGAFMDASGRWRSQVSHNGAVQRGGPLTTEIEAALWYDTVASTTHGVHARLNFTDPERQAFKQHLCRMVQEGRLDR